MSVLEWTSHEGGSYFELSHDGNILIGRHHNCTIVVDSEKVSRHHACIRWDGDRFFVEDLGSRNGTLLNGIRIDQSEPLTDSDVIQVGQTEFVFHEGAPAALIDRPSEVVGSVVVESLAGGLPPGSAEARLRALLEISQRLARSRSLDEVLEGMLDCLFDVFSQAERGVVMLPGESGQLSIRRHKRRDDSDDQIAVSHSVICQVMDEGRAILSLDAADDPRFEGSQSLIGAEIRSLMCAPLIGQDGRSLGVIQIDQRHLDEAFQMDDLELLASVGVLAGQVVENSRLQDEYVKAQLQEQELQIAGEVQLLLLPSSPPEVDGYEFSHRYEPALELSGDYCDFIPLPDGRLVIAVGDVAGKGVAAALYMARLSSAVRLCLEVTQDMAELAARLNRHFVEFGGGHRFLTLLLCLLDPATGTLAMTSAGHCPAAIRQGAAVRFLPTNDESQPPLGILPNTSYLSSVVTIEKGDRIVLFTDGLTEARDADRELYGLDRLADSVARAGGSAEQAASGIVADVRAFAGQGGMTDDLTLVSIRREP